jgi:hypothetical protein
LRKSKRENIMKISNNLVGVAGTYYVAAELSMRGYIALVTLKNTKGIDLIVSSEESFNSVGIQVKTNQNANNQGWILSSKNENLNSDNLIYVFVNLKTNNSRPDFFIVPSNIVADYIKTVHKNWLETPGKKGQQHNDSPMRKFFDKNSDFRERWDIIEDKLSKPLTNPED